ncbi:hypothetical protein L484_017444 [Morus notabilis]|uniref:Uncharacterized protein n=1 Tax=Morus notabilis TaxID=981085 RepID=W9R7R4_9ROSA|nr:hypothetical protein L484_017444 [Morus notabilis]
MIEKGKTPKNQNRCNYEMDRSLLTNFVYSEGQPPVCIHLSQLGVHNDDHLQLHTKVKENAIEIGRNDK